MTAFTFSLPFIPSVARAARLARSRGTLAVAFALACAPPLPDPLPRVAGAEPEGLAVEPDVPVVAVWFTHPVLPDDALGGRIALAPASATRAVLEAVEAEGAVTPAPDTVAVAVRLADGGRRVELRPQAPLLPLTEHVIVVASRMRAADGRAIVDPEGRRRPFVHLFTTAMIPGPPPRPILTEVLADAATPEAGGEYVEILNTGEAPLDLAGLKLVKRTASSSTTCTIVRGEGGPIPVGGYAVIGGGAWDDRYDLPAETPRYACGTTALLGGIANDRGPAIRLLGPDGAVLTSLGWDEPAPVCAAGSVERIDPDGPDASDNLDCAEGEGTPGACNSVSDC
ncbi:MAG TPA: lamin tail domain-containing protein [Anaeromyxobacteraceae bacterium]|nr:lamin tail domain-containing protein [Anaeromyxobacteraceae bacterium]